MLQREVRFLPDFPSGEVYLRSLLTVQLLQKQYCLPYASCSVGEEPEQRRLCLLSFLAYARHTGSMLYQQSIGISSSRGIGPGLVCRGNSRS